MSEHVDDIKIGGGSGVPRGMIVVVGPDRTVTWLGPAQLYAQGLFQPAPGSFVNLHPADYVELRARLEKTHEHVGPELSPAD